MREERGIGDLFSARLAGYIVNTDILHKIEFASTTDGDGAKALRWPQCLWRQAHWLAT